jgi:hypothetical protein
VTPGVGEETDEAMVYAMVVDTEGAVAATTPPNVVPGGCRSGTLMLRHSVTVGSSNGGAV